MKKLSKLLLIFTVIFLAWSCKDDDDPKATKPDLEKDADDNYILPGSITSNMTLKAEYKYILTDWVYVESPAVLTIEPGTVIKGKDKGSLFIKPGAKIMAEGTKEKPIVFTSAKAKGTRNYGDWGGLVILGSANVNKPNAVVEGEDQSTFGGSINDENSGILKYVRVEFAGIPFLADKEINGITFGGVGSGTTVDYVQVSYSGDDSYEWFGGSVNAKHLVAFRGLDDDFDTDNGYSGKVQYAVSLRDPSIADQCTCSSSNGFESDNDGTGSTATPQTNAQFSNVSIFLASGTVNNKYNDGVLIRRNSAMSLLNSVIYGSYPKAGLELNGDASKALYPSSITLKGIVLAGMNKKLSGLDSTTFVNETSNLLVSDPSTLKLDANYNSLTAPKFVPQSGSLLLSGAAALPTGFEAASFRGAFGTEDWTAGWTNFDPQNTEY
jgi:hypothetical protein